MFWRILFAVVMAAGWSCGLQAAPDCLPSTAQAKSAEPIVDWYDNYIRPYRTLAGNAGAARLGKSQVEAFIEETAPFHRRAVLDPLFFETLAQQLSAGYTGLAGFNGIDTAAAEKIYKTGSGQKLDFSLLCINARSVRAPDDAFAITLFGVTADDCQHVGLRGLVFSETLVNGSANGQCRPDLRFYRMYVILVPAGTNDITFVCRKERGGCARQ